MLILLFETMSHNSTVELIVWNFVRTEYEEQFDQRNMTSPLKQLIINYTKKIIASSIISIAGECGQEKRTHSWSVAPPLRVLQMFEF